MNDIAILEAVQQAVLTLADDLVIPAPMHEGKRWTIVGKSGAGKTNTLLILARELILAGWTVVILDPMNAYRALKKAGLPIIVAGERESAELKITEDNAALVADYTFDQRASTILAINDGDEGMEILKPYLERLWQRIYQQPEDGPFVPIALLIDEARLYVPQQGLKPVTKIITKMAQLGRQLHLSMAIATQRPANVQKDFLTQSNMMIFHSMRGVDVTPLKDEMAMPEREARLTLRKFVKGQAIVVSDPDLLDLGEEDFIIRRIRAWETDLSTPLPALAAGAVKPVDTVALDQLRKAMADAQPVDEDDELARLRELDALHIRTEDETNRELKMLKAQIESRDETIKELRKQVADLEAGLTPLPVMKPVQNPLPTMDVASWDGRSQLATDRAVKRQRNEFDALLRDIRSMDKKNRLALCFLTQRESMSYDRKMLARMTGYSLSSFKLGSVIALDLVKRQGHPQNLTYKSVVRDVVKKRFPDLDSDELVERIAKLERI